MCVFLPAVSKLDHWNAEAVIITQQPGNTDTPVWEEHIHRLYDSNITELHTTAEIWRSLLTNQWQSSMNLWGCDCSADTELPAARGKWTENKPHSNISPFARLEQWTCVQTELRLFPRHGDVLSFFLLNVTVSSPPLSSSISTYNVVRAVSALQSTPCCCFCFHLKALIRGSGPFLVLVSSTTLSLMSFCSVSRLRCVLDCGRIIRGFVPQREQIWHCCRRAWPVLLSITALTSERLQSYKCFPSPVYLIHAYVSESNL